MVIIVLLCSLINLVLQKDNSQPTPNDSDDVPDPEDDANGE